MSHCTTVIDAPAERVFGVLADPQRYPDWVIGADTVRGADDSFPRAGARLYHRVGWGPLKLDDHTEVLASEPPYRLELRAKARPLGTARVSMLLAPRGAGSTYVTMIEEPADALSRLLFNPLLNLLLRGRNEASLGRLKRIAEDGAKDAAGSR